MPTKNDTREFQPGAKVTTVHGVKAKVVRQEGGRVLLADGDVPTWHPLQNVKG